SLGAAYDQSASVYAKRQEARAFGGQSCGHASVRAGLGEEQNAASAAGATDLGRLRSGFARGADQSVDERRGDAGRIGAPQLPFFAQQARNLAPIRTQQALAHGAGDGGDLLK